MLNQPFKVAALSASPIFVAAKPLITLMPAATAAVAADLSSSTPPTV